MNITQIFTFYNHYMRWKHNFIEKGESFKKFWKDYIASQSRDILFLLGLGFDPRNNEALYHIIGGNNVGLGKRHFRVVQYFENSHKLAIEQDKRVAANKEALEKIIKTVPVYELVYKDIYLKSLDNKSIASREATKIIHDASSISGFSDIIVDISAMPRNIYFPLVNKLLSIIDATTRQDDSNRRTINLHIVVTENSSVDALIKNNGLAEEASFIHGFSISDLTKTQDFHRVWIPLLGEGRLKQLELISKFVNPDETCPLLPFPARNIRRGDQLITEYNRILFNELNIDGKNIIYADEQNPFQVYMLLLQTIKRYQESFSMLKGCKVYISALSSKLLSIGALLAVYESKGSGAQIGIAQVDSLGHTIEDHTGEFYDCIQQSELFEIWLTGEPYE